MQLTLFNTNLLDDFIEFLNLKKPWLEKSSDRAKFKADFARIGISEPMELVKYDTYRKEYFKK